MQLRVRLLRERVTVCGQVNHLGITGWTVVQAMC